MLFAGWTHVGKAYEVTKYGLFFQTLVWMGIYMAGYLAPPFDTWFDEKPESTYLKQINAKVHTDK